ncbi:MAG: hypothetical protein KGI80_03440 [Verrucomicrobiota bacterium]|nr:hypothetical protein [Verrucomicrobiota bacterium]
MDLADKIRKIEALIAGAKSDGERQAAEFARRRLQDKIEAKPIEYTITSTSHWRKKLFIAICNKHGLRTYRYKRQKYTTTMVLVSRPFMDQVLWPEFDRCAKTFDQLASEIMNDLISKIHLVKDEDETIIAGELPAATTVSAL